MDNHALQTKPELAFHISLVDWHFHLHLKARMVDDLKEEHEMVSDV
jgi:hypothetical protein